MTGKLLDDCFINDRDRLRHADAIAILKSRIIPIAATVRVPLADAHGRILAEAVDASAPVPAHTNAAVDGYSFAHCDATLAATIGLPVAGRAAAGHPVDAPPGHSAVRIFTGAAVPPLHDTVAMQEDCERFMDGAAAYVRIPAGLKRAANVRKAGEDISAGTRLFSSGAVLRPQDLAALASIGASHVEVFSPLRVAIVSSGDEVVPPGQPLAHGQVYDANAPMLASLVRLAGVDARQLGITADSAEAFDALLAAAAQDYDVVITTGGASQGEEDHLVASLDRLGKRHLWQLAIKPGRPMSFGQIPNGDRSTVVVGLPGNPVAVFVCFLMYVFPLLRALGGARWPEPRRWLLPATFDVPARKTGRREFWRGTMRTTADGRMAIEKFPRDGSGLISGLRMADGLIDVPEDTEAVRQGDLVAFIPFTEFGIPAA